MLRVAFLTTDSREALRRYEQSQLEFGTAPVALLQGFAQLPEVEVHVISCVQQPVISPEKIAPNIFFHSLLVPKFGWLRTGYQGCIRAVRKKLKAIQPDIVHGQGTERDCALSAVFSGFPNVLTIHGNMKAIAEIYGARPGSFHWLAAKLETVALKRAGGVFCNSAYTENLVAPRARKTWRVPNALRDDFFAPLPLRKSGHPPVILNIGVIEPRKQQVELLAAARKLFERGLKFQLQFVGARSAQSDYGKLFSSELAIAETTGYARHLGFLNTPQVIAAMDAASALVHFPTEEAFGLVAAEALVRHLKFFGAHTGGVVDIASGVDGVELFPPQDFSALEEAITRWLDQGCPQPQNAAPVMRERYHPQVIARRHLEIYREVLKIAEILKS
jgi:glycosyltransferase involved in cell wall biosynthesis